MPAPNSPPGGACFSCMQLSSHSSVDMHSAPLPPASERAMSTWAGRKDHASTLNFFSLLFQCLISTTTFASAGDMRKCVLLQPVVAASEQLDCLTPADVPGNAAAPAGIDEIGVFRRSSWSRLMTWLALSKDPGGVSDCRAAKNGTSIEEWAQADAELALIYTRRHARECQGLHLTEGRAVDLGSV